MDYRNLSACLDLVQRLDLHDADEAHSTLARTLEGLRSSELPGEDQLEVLETIRLPLEQVQEALARRYAAHPLPPDSEENQTFLGVVGLWRAMANGYVHILSRDIPSGALSDQRALLWQRRMAYTTRALLEYFRAHRMVPMGLWAQLHDSYTMAEEQDLTHVRVPDALNAVWRAQSTAEAYIAALLVDLANPFGRNPREFIWVCRWAQRFAPYCSLKPAQEATPDSRPTAYGLDLRRDHGLRPLGVLTGGPGMRRFDGSRLAGQIRAVLKQLKQGTRPRDLGLGDDCPTEAGAQLLLSLYRPWGLAAAGRRFRRRNHNGMLELTGDWLAIGFHVQGKLFTQPSAQPVAVTRSFGHDMSLLTLGERAPAAAPPEGEHGRQLLAARHGFGCEHWEILDESVGGFRLCQRRPVERLSHRQLIGLRPPDGSRFLLAMISWLMYREDATLEAGVSLLTGVPRVVAARPAAIRSGSREPYAQAFVVSATAALETPETIVLPGGIYKSMQTVELFDDGERAVRLMSLITHGTNFDQFSFEPVSAGGTS